MTSKSFDLNIEQILENWEVRHGIREVIANALDEQALTATDPVLITKREGIWFVRDSGRGIRYSHLTQNENQEKLDSPNVIGRFGIGLKDALATFERHGVKAQIRSRFGTISTHKSAKHGFGDILTLHAIIEDPLDLAFVGTEFELAGADDMEMEAAKSMFLKFSDVKVLATTRFGQIINSREGSGAIYINGVKVAEEPNFLFSYNITLLTAAIRKAINRERTHVGRTAYSESVKKILLASTNADVARMLADDIARFQLGEMHDELAWIDVQEHAVRILNAQEKVLMVTAEEAMRFPDLIDQARRSGSIILTIPENLRAKIADTVDIDGNRMVDLTQFTQNYNDSFTFDFVEVDVLTTQERKIFHTTGFVIDAFGGRPPKVTAIKISNTMRPDIMSSSITLGCWDPATSSIVVWRPQLNSFEEFSAVLIHELVHAKTGFMDVTRDFETALTTTIGDLCLGWWNAVQNKAAQSKPADMVADKRIHLLQSELETARLTIARFHQETHDATQAAEKLKKQVIVTALPRAATQSDSTTIPTPQAISPDPVMLSILEPVELQPVTLPVADQAILTSKRYRELLATKETQAGQLDDALQIVVRLRADLDAERKNTTRALNECHVIQTDLNKYRSMQHEAQAARALSQSKVKYETKPWYRFW